MNLTSWYYLSGQEVKGPISKTELQTLIFNDTLNSNDLVWTLPLVEWKKIRDVPALEQERFCVVPFPPSSVHLKSMHDTQILQVLAPTPSFGLRYAARLFDIYMAAYIIYFVLHFLIPHFFKWHMIYICTCILLLCVLWETLFLWIWGKTPGKWLIASSVTCFKGNKLDLKSSFFRSVYLYNGYGCSFFFADLISNFPNYNKELHSWILNWNKTTNSIVAQATLDWKKLYALYSALTLFTVGLCFA